LYEEKTRRIKNSSGYFPKWRKNKMGKISPVAAKYLIHATIEIDGTVNRPDVVGAIFGQTEGLLGSELELRELQRSGRIGRIDVNVTTKGGKTNGKIDVPSSMDKSETSLIGAALEIIQRIGPCNAKVSIDSIEDVRTSRRNFVVTRAKELLKIMVDDVMPDSQELSDEVTKSVRVMGVIAYGPDKLTAGPGVMDSDDVIIVEGRADVLNLLKYGIKNAIAVNGTSIPQTIIELSKKKEVTVFVDGDRGGKLIIQELLSVAQIDYVTMAPDGKEVEEITKKEIHQALRAKITAEQAKLELLAPAKTNRYTKDSKIRDGERDSDKRKSYSNRKSPNGRRTPNPRYNKSDTRSRPAYKPRKPRLTADQLNSFNGLLNDLIGTKGAFLLDEKLDILGKVPLTELSATIKSFGSGTSAVVLDGTIDKELVGIAERLGLKYLVGMDASAKSERIHIVVEEDF